MSAPTPGGRENISIGSWSRWRACRAKNGSVYGSIPRRRRKILRGIREAKDLSAYDNLGNAAYLRAKEDYLMGINFSRALTLKYGNTVKGYLKRDRAVISVGRVMTCVLGIIVKREREIRSFTKTPFYRVIGNFKLQEKPFTAEWRAVEGSKYYNSPALYKENGFKKKEDAERLIAENLPQNRLARRPSPASRRKKRTRMRRFCTIWQSCRMTVPNILRSARMRLCGSYRNCMRKR